MKLIFVRHGQATAYCADDAGRNLTDFGQQQAHETASYLKGRYPICAIISSPFNRAWQTAQILQETLQADTQTVPLFSLSSITPDDDPQKGLEDIANLLNAHHLSGDDGCVAVVCHMPIVAKMVSVLTALPPVGFDLAGVAVLDVIDVLPELGREIDRFSPKQP